MHFDLRQTDALLTTTRAVRRRLDFSKPVPPAVLRECIEIAVQAPNAENDQDWRWVIVSERPRLSTLGTLYAEFALKVVPRLIESAAEAGEHAAERIYSGALDLANRLPDCPAMILVGSARPLPQGAPFITSSTWFGSLYPAIWSLQLALRSRGLGSVLTTLLLSRADEVARTLELPEDFTQVALLPVAYTHGTDFRPAPRRPLDEVLLER